MTVAAEPKSKIYGAADPALTYTYAPELVAGDSFSGALTREMGEDVDTYAILKGTLTPGDNYTITFTGNDFAINPLAVTVTAEPKSKTYGAADPALTYTYTPALVAGDSFSGALVREVGEDVEILRHIEKHAGTEQQLHPELRGRQLDDHPGGANRYSRQ